ncbi:hypothetical protein [Pseudomonas sp. TE21394]
MLRLVGNIEDIASAIDDFRPSYHLDFSNVQVIAERYLQAEPTSEHVALLAQALCTALRNWGACRRRSPRLRPSAQIESFLRNKQVHKSLVKLSQHSLESFSLSRGGDRVFNPGASFSDARKFDIEILNTLACLASGLFINNTSVTYPMKALLLITGLMPALDSQVRKGLRLAGKVGFTGQQLLPKSTYQAGGRRICHLPFELGQCWELNRVTLREGVRNSLHPELESALGRVFDILLFMQAQTKRRLILKADR